MSPPTETELKQFYREKLIKERDEHKAKMNAVDGELIQKKMKYDITDADWDSIVALLREWDNEKRLYTYAMTKLSPFLGGGR